MVVIGGYNSSNTISLAAICAERVTTYHVEDATAIDPARGTVRHKPIGRAEEAERAGWLAAAGPLRVGITAGASTPNNKIGDTVARILATRGIDPASARVSAVAAPSYGTAELRAGDSRVVIAPGLGGKIVSMQLAGREWLWSDPKRPAPSRRRRRGVGEHRGERRLRRMLPDDRRVQPARRSPAATPRCTSPMPTAA